MHMTKKACCDKEKETVKLTQNDFDSCCQLKIVDHNLTDKFIMTGSDIGSKTPIKILSGLITIEAGANDITTHNEYTDSSPPPLLNNHIYLNNSILLI